MISAFIRLSLRNLFRKNRLFTFINIAGLAMGLASLILVSLFIYDEYSFDRYHKNFDRIYRIVLDFTSENNTVNWAKTSAPIGHFLSGAYPEVEHVVRIRKNPGTDLLSNNEVKFYEEKLFFADSTLFNVFDFKLKSGNPTSALKDKHSIVITELLAKKYFNDGDAIGKTLRFNNLIDLKITGIMDEIPANSHFSADAFISFYSLEELLGEKRLSHWGQMDHYTYVSLTNESTAQQLEEKLHALIKMNAPEWVSEKEKLYLQPLASIHLHSERKDEITPNSRESYSYVLGTISLFILLMACTNFINLSTATQVSRFKEIAIQKVLGARWHHLTIYFLIESLVICLVALLAAYLLASLALPYFNLTTGKHISFLNASWLVAPTIILTIAIGLLSSIIPSIQAGYFNNLRRANPQNLRRNRSTIRSVLITFQFSISILLIIATWVVSSQSKFLKSSRVGFESNNVIVLPVKDRSQNDRHSTIVNELNKVQGVEKVSYSSSTPGSNNSFTYTYTLFGSETGEQTIATFLVDENFFELFKIKLKEGRWPSIDNRDTLSEVIINEAAVKQFRLLQPIGQLVTGKVKGRIVGVIEDFNYASLHSSIEPVIMYSFTPTFRFVSIKISETETKKTIALIEQKWQELYPGYPLEYSFLDGQIQQLYSSEFQLAKAYTSFSIIAVLIAGIGLIGLSTYLLARKLKEISIRKVFGSSTSQLIIWIYLGYIKIIVSSALIAIGIGYYWMGRWLDVFAFKTELRPHQFIMPVAVMTLILLLTTGIQTIIASSTNPIKNLREE